MGGRRGRAGGSEAEGDQIPSCRKTLGLLQERLEEARGDRRQGGTGA